ncbi:MAG: ABC transporter substrate-binding protein [Gammaproteobacteria bacterium]|nr:ABC transporter substrate-binding protein [Gammaproteobacteria bacterium]
MYSSFSERPKHLDPVRSYSSNEYAFIAQIYEPPLQYHYLKRPYQLVPLAASSMPVPVYLDQDNNILDGSDETAAEIAYSIYDIHIKQGVYYQPHPAFVRNQGGFLYHPIQPDVLPSISQLSDFQETASRELIAEDYVYQIKRMADVSLHSPVLGLMQDYIVGLKETSAQIKKDRVGHAKTSSGDFFDYRTIDLIGVQVLDRYTFRIKVYGEYPQLLYWLAMPFFAPIPWEADRFYAQQGLIEKNINFDWYPVGTGPFMLTVNNPNRQMVLEKNPNFKHESYPQEGSVEDVAAGLLQDAGKALPFMDKVIFSLEKENIPYWSKFLQGYYDVSAISSDSFDQAIQLASSGNMTLSDEMREQGIVLQTAVASSIYYMGFNMLDSIVGGDSDKARKLRQAISIAINYEEYISIFMNGRGISAQGPIPPGIFGFRQGEEGMNPYVYDWRQGQAERKSIVQAKRLMVEAGYPQGRNEMTGKPLLLYLDSTGGGVDDRARMDWLRKQFSSIDIQLIIRNTDYNRFQEKMRKGTAQIFQWGWNADYPDPENFLFLLYGENAKVAMNGENAANYRNPAFDRLFLQMKTMDNSTKRQQIIDQMISIVQRDAPWIWGVNPRQFSLHHAWYGNAKTNLMANNTLKYKKIDSDLRTQMRQQWNKPVIWPLLLMLLLLILLVLPAVVLYRRREQMSVSKGMK